MASTLPSRNQQLGRDYEFGLGSPLPSLASPFGAGGGVQTAGTVQPQQTSQPQQQPQQQQQQQQGQNQLFQQFFDFLNAQQAQQSGGPVANAIQQREAGDINRRAELAAQLVGSPPQNRFLNEPQFTPEMVASRNAAGFNTNIAPPGRGVETQRDQIFMPQNLPTINYPQATQLELDYNFPFSPGARGGMTPYGPIMRR